MKQQLTLNDITCLIPVLGPLLGGRRESGFVRYHKPFIGQYSVRLYKNYISISVIPRVRSSYTDLGGRYME